MTDPVRSRLMARIRGRDTDPEGILRKARPDLVFVGPRVAVYVDGCFWHGCPEHYVAPRASTSFWRDKLRKNVDRDRRQTLKLEDEGWRVVRVWEHEVYTDLERVVARIRRAVQETGRDRPGPEWRVVSVEPLDAVGNRERRRLESLRDGTRTRVETRTRSTAKW